jgi:hypothetical protein
MDNKLIRVGVANEGEIDIETDVLKSWSPKNLNYIGDTVYFKQDKSYFSMKLVDFNKLYK